MVRNMVSAENPEPVSIERLASLRDAFIRTFPFMAVLFVLSAYLWPLDQAQISAFSDVPAHHAPNVETIASALWEHGELPRWNALDFGGVPTLSDPQVGLYNPVYWILTLRPTLHSFGLMVLGYVLIGALGMMLYVRKLGGSVLAAASAGIVFSLGGKILAHLAVPGHTIFSSIYLLPMVLFSIEGMLRTPSMIRLAGVASLVGFIALSTHPQALWYMVCTIVVASAIAVVHNGIRARSVVALVLAATLSAGLAAILWLPVIDSMGEYSRSMSGFADLARWQTLNGRVRAHFIELILGSGQTWESFYYFGGSTLWCVALGLLSWRPRQPLSRLCVLPFWMTIVTLLIGLEHLNDPLSVLFGIEWFRIPARALLLTGFSSACLVAYAVDRLPELKGRPLRFAVIGASIFASGLLLMAEAPITPWIALVAIIFAGMLHSGLLRSRRIHPIGRWTGGSLLLVALAFDTGNRIMPEIVTEPEATIVRPVSDLRMPIDPNGMERIVEPNRHLVGQGIPELFKHRAKLETLTGYNPLIPWRFILYMSYAGDYDYATIHDTVPTPMVRSRFFDLFAVTHVLLARPRGKGPWPWRATGTALPRAYLVPGFQWSLETQEGVDDQLKIEAELRSLAILEKVDPRRTVLLHERKAARTLREDGILAEDLEPFRPVEITSRTPNQMTLEFETDHPAILVLSEPYFPGWRAWDGVRELSVMRANVLFRAVAIDSGVHHVVLEFRPDAWIIGRAITMTSLLVIAALLAFGSWRLRRGIP